MRNKVVFENERWSVDKVISRAREIVSEMRGVGVEGGAGVQEERNKWRKPSRGLYKINIDAGLMEGDGFGLGAICRDRGGKVQWGVSVQEGAVREPTVLEAEAILMGLTEAKEKELKSVEIESDCLSVIEDLRNRRRGRSDLNLIYDDIYAMCNFFDTLEFSYVRRSGNRVAHELAHARPWSVGKRRWIDVLPMTLMLL
ncbi:uncharacterized protein LOC141617744 [Silene latifolia]|uniref:uncharacterized protein LOC141617744 n=1 Tax=Silene latifolia TaxID=37657 RepID=UPI003D76E609